MSATPPSDSPPTPQPPRPPPKAYLGDGVYADFDGMHIVLTTENGLYTTNRICLDGEVIDGLGRFVAALDAYVADMRALHMAEKD